LILNGEKTIDKRWPQLLVVDADEDFCTIFSNKLADIFIIQSVVSIAIAMEQVGKYIPDEMILDNYLPDGLGAKYVAKCKQTNTSVK
jgi:response regulator of citrate/malate metabolism